MRIFFSAGEPSGDVHSASLIRAMRDRAAGLELAGFGGEHMQASGCRLLFPLAEFPVIGFLPVIAQLGRFIGLYRQVKRHFDTERPDAVVLVDYPGFMWWVARAAKSRGIPVFYFLPPQVWAWATWRVGKMRRLVDHVLCMLPFEKDWYDARGANAILAGHPYFDDLRAHEPDRKFLADYTSTPESPVIGILPGSRTAEVKRNFPAYLRAAERIARVFPNARFPVACLRPAHLEMVQAHLAASIAPSHFNGPRPDVRPHLGLTAEIIQSSRVCMAKSGSVSLELLFHTKPSTILYQLSRADYVTYRFLRGIGTMAASYITLVNILAGHELFPEYVTAGDVSESLSRHVLNWLEDPAAHARVVSELAAVKSRVAASGATARTADYILHALGALGSTRAAA